MIYDCFLYNGEEELLDLRLLELGDIVDYHVVVQNDYPFQGDRRRSYEPPEDEFIINVHVSEPLPTGSWAAEAYCRNAIVRGLNRATADDLVLIETYLNRRYEINQVVRRTTAERIVAMINQKTGVSKPADQPDDDFLEAIARQLRDGAAFR